MELTGVDWTTVIVIVLGTIILAVITIGSSILSTSTLKDRIATLNTSVIQIVGYIQGLRKDKPEISPGIARFGTAEGSSPIALTPKGPAMAERIKTQAIDDKNSSLS